MLDFHDKFELVDRARNGEAQASAPVAARAAERFAPTSATTWTCAVLDEIDYGMLLLGDGARVLITNVAARAELDQNHPLHLCGDELRARRGDDAAELRAAIEAAANRGLRKLLNLRLCGTATVASVSVVPLHAASAEQRREARPAGRPQVLVLLGKRRLGGVLAIEAFARSQGLSGGETRVLRELAEGMRPSELAEKHGVAISTVRTQIGSIRAKTGAASIRELLGQIAVLPPLLGVLRPQQCKPHGFASTSVFGHAG